MRINQCSKTKICISAMLLVNFIANILFTIFISKNFINNKDIINTIIGISLLVSTIFNGINIFTGAYSLYKYIRFKSIFNIEYFMIIIQSFIGILLIII